jgi:hypothetical protein
VCEVLSLDRDSEAQVTPVRTTSQEAWPGAERKGREPPGKSRGGTPTGERPPLGPRRARTQMGLRKRRGLVCPARHHETLRLSAFRLPLFLERDVLRKPATTFRHHAPAQARLAKLRRVCTAGIIGAARGAVPTHRLAALRDRRFRISGLRRHLSVAMRCASDPCLLHNSSLKCGATMIAGRGRYHYF